MAMVKGLRIPVTEECIAQVSSLPRDSEPFPETNDVRSAKAQFTEHGDPPLEVTKKVTIRLSLPPLQAHRVTYIIKYTTCEGEQSQLHSVHFKLLHHLRHGSQMNVPNFLYNILKKVEAQVQKVNLHSVSHHCLIQLLVEQALVERNPGMQWVDFLAISGARPLRQIPSSRKATGASSSKPTEVHSENSSSEDEKDTRKITQKVPKKQKPSSKSKKNKKLVLGTRVQKKKKGKFPKKKKEKKPMTSAKTLEMGNPIAKDGLSSQKRK